MQLPDRYLNWRTIDGRKVPVRRDGVPCDAHDPANWVTLAEAESTGLGVAWVLNGDGWFFLDLDKCLVDGVWSQQARAIWASFSGAWGEVSQSGAGLHILGRCDPSQMADRRNKWDGWLECYTDKRFVAFGGQGWAPIGGQARDVDWTQQLLRLVPEREHLGGLMPGVDPEWNGPDDDDALLSIAMRSGSAAAKFGVGITFADLWEVRLDVLHMTYPPFDGGDGFDHSSADMALMSMLAFWTGKDQPRMDRLFRRSGLMRDKYDKREDYRRATIQSAARLCRAVYGGGGKARSAQAREDGAESGEVYLTVPEMIEHFKGCVYVRDAHRVLVPDGTMLKPEQFNAVYGGHIFQMMPDGTKPTKKAFEALTECAAHHFPQAVRPVFRPGESPGIVLPDGGVNIYVKPDIRAVEGDVGPFLDVLRRVLPDDSDRAILTAYMASVVQNPGVKFQWAPVLQGTEGNGKTMIASCVAYAIGQQYVHQPRASQLAGTYNEYMEGNIFIIVEEIHMGNRREMLDELKPLVTNQWIEMHKKYGDKRMIENVANWFFCTNYRDAVLKSKNDRRYAIFYTAQQSAADLVRDGMDNGYFPQVYDWLRDCGYSHVAHYLAHYPIPPELDPAKMCHRAPNTSSTGAAIEASVGGVEAEIMEAVDSQTVGFRGGWISSWHLRRMLRDNGFRLPYNKIGTILAEMGYIKGGRSSRRIMREDATQPILWNNGKNTEDYIIAQGPGYE